VLARLGQSGEAGEFLLASLITSLPERIHRVPLPPVVVDMRQELQQGNAPFSAARSKTPYNSCKNESNKNLIYPPGDTVRLFLAAAVVM